MLVGPGTWRKWRPGILVLPVVGPVLRAIYPDVSYRILPGIGHWCMYEAADAFNGALQAAWARL